MKASHFNIGRPDANMLCPKPTQPIEPAQQIASFDVEAAKKSLRQASWTVGQSPMKYETIQKSCYLSDGKHGRQNEMAEQKNQIQ